MGRPKDPNSKRSQAERKRDLRRQKEAIDAEKQRLEQMKADLEAAKQQATQTAAVDAEELPDTQATDSSNLVEPDFTENQTDASDNFDDDSVIDNIDDFLNQPTEHSPQQQTAEPIAEPERQADDFAEPTPNFTNEPAADGENIDTQIPNKDFANMVIMGLNKFNTIGGDMMYRRHFFSGREFLRAKFLYDKHHTFLAKKKLVDTTEEEQLLIVAYADYLEFCQRLPFDKEEEKLLRTPLEKMSIGKHITSSPTTAFLFAVIIICVARYTFIFQPKPQYDKYEPEQDTTDSSGFDKYEEVKTGDNN